MKPSLTWRGPLLGVGWLISHLASGTSPRSLRQFLAAQKTMWIVAAVCVSPGDVVFSFWDVWDLSRRLDVCVFSWIFFSRKHMILQKKGPGLKRKLIIWTNHLFFRWHLSFQGLVINWSVYLQTLKFQPWKPKKGFHLIQHVVVNLCDFWEFAHWWSCFSRTWKPGLFLLSNPVKTIGYFTSTWKLDASHIP